jgi:hypothetical protein
VRLPPGVATADGVKAELHTEKNKMPGLVSRDAPRADNGCAVLAGSVELYYRSGWRLLEVRMPGQLDRIFKLNLPASPRRSTGMTRWQKADFIAEPACRNRARPAPTRASRSATACSGWSDAPRASPLPRGHDLRPVAPYALWRC